MMFSNNRLLDSRSPGDHTALRGSPREGREAAHRHLGARNHRPRFCPVALTQSCLKGVAFRSYPILSEGQSSACPRLHGRPPFPCPLESGGVPGPSWPAGSPSAAAAARRHPEAQYLASLGLALHASSRVCEHKVKDQQERVRPGTAWRQSH